VIALFLGGATQVDPYCAGMDNANASSASAHVFFRRPLVAAEVERQREMIRRRTRYDVVAAMQEAEQAMAFALDSGNANAYVRAVELRSRSNSLLIDKQEIKVEMASLLVWRCRPVTLGCAQASCWMSSTPK
jgi:hypothetical protein